jgi:hypothetical protein
MSVGSYGEVRESSWERVAHRASGASIHSGRQMHKGDRHADRNF